MAEASIARTPVAAHVKTRDQILACLKAGVHTIEHGYEMDETCFAAMKETNAVWVPTLAAVRTIYGAQDARYVAIKKTFKAAVDAGVTIAAGGDTGVFAHGDNALEMECMVDAGMSVEQALRAATRHGFYACGGQNATGRQFGALREGYAGDITAVRGALTKEAFGKTMRNVVFVAKDGEVVLDRLSRPR